MGVTFGNFPCQEPNEVLESCQKNDLPTDWYGKANRFMTSVGPAAGRGWLLMSRGQIADLDIDALHDLIFFDNNAGTITIKQLVFVRARALTPGFALDSESYDRNGVYLVDVRDIRYLAQNEFYANPVNKQYNVRAPGAAATYYTDSQNAGSPWTWQTMLDNLWAAVNVTELGASPTLPFTPDGSPEGFKFINVPAWKAYNEILDRLGCAIALDPTEDTNPATIYITGGDDPSFETAETTYRGNRIWDDATVESRRAKIPSLVRVVFHKFSEKFGTEKTTGTTAGGQWSIDQVHHVEITNPDATTGVQMNSTAILYDDLPALVDFAGTITNSTALQDRAQERADDYFAGADDTLLRRTYANILNTAGFFPGLQVSGVAYGDTGGGYVTEIAFYPDAVKPSDKATWESCGCRLDERMRPPDLARVSYPIYPITDQILKVVETTTTANVYAGTVQRTNPATPVQDTLETCWIYVPNGDMLAANQYCFGRLYGPGTFTPMSGGPAQTRPLYTTDFAPGGSASVFSGARVTSTTNQARLATGGGLATFALQFDTEIFDSGGYFDSGVSATRITVPTDGYYMVGAHVRATITVQNVGFLAIFSSRGNGPMATQSNIYLQQAGIDTYFCVAVLLNLLAGDYVEAVMRDHAIGTTITAKDRGFWITKQ